MIEPRISEARRSAGRWRSLTLASLLAAGLLAGLIPSSTASATAIVIPPASSLVECVRNLPDTTLIETSNCTLPGAAQASVSQVPFVELQTEASLPAAGPPNSAFARLGYSFEVVGGTPGTQVPLLISASLFTSAPALNSAVAKISVGSTSIQFTAPQFHAVEAACSGQPDLCAVQSAPNSSFDGTFSVIAVDGILDVVQLTAQAGVGPEGGTAIATVDPFIFIDPSFADANEFSIVLSDGVANALSTASSVPEPSSVALLVVGLTGLVGLRRSAGQRSRPTSSAAAGSRHI